MVLEGPNREGDSAKLHVYTTKGEPIRTLTFPTEGWLRELTVGPHWLVIGEAGGSGWTLVRVEDDKLFRFDSGLGDPGYWTAGLTPDGKTLLLLHTRRLELARFALP